MARASVGKSARMGSGWIRRWQMGLCGEWGVRAVRAVHGVVEAVAKLNGEMAQWAAGDCQCQKGVVERGGDHWTLGLLQTCWANENCEELVDFFH